MAEAMSEERLARLRADNEPRGDHLSGLTADEVGELLDEVERLRGVEKRLVQQHRDAYLIVMEERDQARNELRKCADLNRGLVNENADLRTQLAEIGETREEWRFDDGNGWFTVSLKPLSPADVQHLKKQTGRPVERRLAGEWQDAE